MINIKYFSRFVILCGFLSIWMNSNSQVSEFPINITSIEGNEFDTKPSLQERLNGSTNLIIVKPISTSTLDDILFGEIFNYFSELGFPTTFYQVPYNKEKSVTGNVNLISAQCLLSEIDFIKNANTLVIIPTYNWAYGSLGNRLDVTISIVDLVGENQWNIKIDKLNVDANKEKLDKKFNKRIKQLITEYYSYDPTFSIMPWHLKSDWTENNFKQYFKNAEPNNIEGVYDVNNERIGVKLDKDFCLLVYLDGNSFDGWESGTIKALLEPTATPNLYKGSLWNRNLITRTVTVAFEPGLLTIIEDNKTPESHLKLYPKINMAPVENFKQWSGTGFALKNGYIVTNNHVAEDASDIEIFGINGDFTKGYKAKVIGKDKVSDIALLQIEDPTIISSWTNPPYSVNFSMADVGEDVFALGYPLIGTMGEEVKLTNGIISSRSGFEGDVTNYQISVPIQPGNSGGPMFNEDGELVGIICAKHEGAENVGYAIKTSYLKNLIESVASSNIVPTNNTLKGKALKDQVKSIRNNVFLIKCSK